MPKTDFTSGATGAIGGATTGASIAGPAGAVVGGVIGGISGLWGGKKKKKKKISTMDERQKRLYELQNQAVMGEGPLADLYSWNPEAANEVFSKMYSNPAYRQFEEELVPKITGQFRKEGLQNSSYVGDALSKAARDVQENLNAQRTNYLYSQEQNAQNARRNAINDIQNRQTFAYDTSAPSGGGGFDIDKVLNSITPETVDMFKGFLKQKGIG